MVEHRSPKPGVAGSIPVSPASGITRFSPQGQKVMKMAKATPAEFVKQVRQEVSKVSFPTRRETLISSVMVLIMVTLVSLFLLLTDSIVQYVIKHVLGFGQ